MCIEANHILSPDMKNALNSACEAEKSQLGKQNYAGNVHAFITNTDWK